MGTSITGSLKRSLPASSPPLVTQDMLNSGGVCFAAELLVLTPEMLGGIEGFKHEAYPTTMDFQHQSPQMKHDSVLTQKLGNSAVS